MKTSKKWESLITVLISIAIIAVSFLSIYRLIDADKSFEFYYKKSNDLWILDRNTNYIVKKLDTSKVSIWEEFYLYKTWSNIKILTWSTNIDYKYIDNLWNYTNSWSKNINIYSRSCILYNDSIEWKYIKCSIKEIVKK